MTSSPWSTTARCTTDRMTAFRPGQSPPDVRTPMRIARNNLLDVGRDRTALSGSISATLAAPGGPDAPCVRLLDDPAHLCGAGVRRAARARPTPGCPRVRGHRSADRSGGLLRGGDALVAQCLVPA